MKLVKSTSLAVTMCMLLSCQVFADDIDTKDMVNLENAQSAVTKSPAIQKAPVAEMTIPNTFTANTPAVADEVNANFTAAKSAVDGNSAEIEQLKALVGSMAKYTIDGAGSPFLNVPQAIVEANGWSVCFSEEFDRGVTAISDILATCSGTDLMLACRETGSLDFVLAAYAPRADVAFDTGTDETTTHAANGTEWYFNEDRSWGFAQGGDTVTKRSCDTGGTNDEYRMCMHTNSGNLIAGWRCGESTGIGAGWERVILHK